MSSRTENTEKGGSAQVRRPGDCWCRRHGPRRRLRSRRGPIASRVHAPRRWHTRAPPRDALGSHLHQSVCTSGPYTVSIVSLFMPDDTYRSANRTCTTARDARALLGSAPRRLRPAGGTLAGHPPASDHIGDVYVSPRTRFNPHRHVGTDSTGSRELRSQDAWPTPLALVIDPSRRPVLANNTSADHSEI